MDEQGYPRADVDVYTVRTLLNRKAGISIHLYSCGTEARAVLQTDHKQIMARVEAALKSHHSLLKAAGSGSSAPASQIAPSSRTQPPSSVSATISAALPSSVPAANDDVRGAFLYCHWCYEHFLADLPRAVSTASLSPFYLVDQVWEVFCLILVHRNHQQDSPASVAGLRIGDKIVRLGTVTKANEVPKLL